MTGLLPCGRNGFRALSFVFFAFGLASAADAPHPAHHGAHAHEAEAAKLAELHALADGLLADYSKLNPAARMRTVGLDRPEASSAPLMLEASTASQLIAEDLSWTTSFALIQAGAEEPPELRLRVSNLSMDGGSVLAARLVEADTGLVAAYASLARRKLNPTRATRAPHSGATHSHPADPPRSASPEHSRHSEAPKRASP